MPYKNILWVKLEKRLLNDYRFYTLSESAQLIFIKLLLLSAETENKIPKNTKILKASFRTVLEESQIQECIDEIRNNYPKFKEKALYYHFQEWEYKTNYIKKGSPKEIPRSSKGNQKDGLEEIREEENRLDKSREEKKPHKTISYLNSIPEEEVSKLVKRFVISEEQVKSEAESALNWLKANGKTKSDYRAYLLNWIKGSKKNYVERSPEEDERAERIKRTKEALEMPVSPFVGQIVIKKMS